MKKAFTTLGVIMLALFATAQEEAIKAPSTAMHVESHYVPGRTYFGGVYYVPPPTQQLDRRLTKMFPDVKSRYVDSDDDVN